MARTKVSSTRAPSNKKKLLKFTIGLMNGTNKTHIAVTVSTTGCTDCSKKIRTVASTDRTQHATQYPACCAACNVKRQSQQRRERSAAFTTRREHQYFTFVPADASKPVSLEHYNLTSDVRAFFDDSNPRALPTHADWYTYTTLCHRDPPDDAEVNTRLMNNLGMLGIKPLRRPVRGDVVIRGPLSFGLAHAEAEEMVELLEE